MKYLTVSQQSHCLKHFITTFCFNCICSIVPPHSKLVLVLVQYASQRPLGLKADPSFTVPNIQCRCCVFFSNIEFFKRHRRIVTSNFWNGILWPRREPHRSLLNPLLSVLLPLFADCDGGGVVRNVFAALRNRPAGPGTAAVPCSTVVTVVPGGPGGVETLQVQMWSE